MAWNMFEPLNFSEGKEEMYSKTSILVSINLSLQCKQFLYFSLRASLWSSCVVLPLLALTWMSAVLAMTDKRSILFQILFAVFDSLQGFVIVMVHCILRREVGQILILQPFKLLSLLCLSVGVFNIYLEYLLSSKFFELSCNLARLKSNPKSM